MQDWHRTISAEWRRRAERRKPSARLFPLANQNFDDREIVAAVEVLLTGRLTMGAKVKEFERRFAKTVGAPHAVMVNSGSSALLLALAVATNPQRQRRLQRGDEVLVPAVCWPTSLWPLVQMGLTPVFVDVDPTTLNIDPDDLRKKTTRKTRALMAVHILGNAAPMAELQQHVRDHDLVWFEDTCESLGTRHGTDTLGTLGDFGCYSFYYSHHITTGEGGMVVCRTAEDDDLLRCLRAHGWSRDLSNRAAVEAKHSDVDPRFLFVNTGYNLRPTEVAAAFGLCQLRRMKGMNQRRNRNRARLIEALRAHPRWDHQLTFPHATDGLKPAWFGFAALLSTSTPKGYRAYLDRLTARGVENRPIVSGNFARQPAVKAAGIRCDPKKLVGAEEVHRRGFFVGLHTEDLDDARVQRLADLLLDHDFAR